MRVNNINSNPSFGRAIKISGFNMKSAARCDIEKMKLLDGLQDVLNGKKSEAYSDNLAEKFRNFFKRILRDYNGKDGIVISPAGKEMALFSGDEAKKVKLYNAQATFTKKWADGLSMVDYTKKDEITQNAHKTAYEKAFALIENGEENKPVSILKFTFDNSPKQEISSVYYASEAKSTPPETQFDEYNKRDGYFYTVEAELLDLKNS